jgi:hypothetical protein
VSGGRAPRGGPRLGLGAGTTQHLHRAPAGDQPEAEVKKKENKGGC